MRNAGVVSLAAYLFYVTVFAIAEDTQKKAPQQSGGSLNLQIVDVIHTNTDEMSTMAPDRCDADGNVYMRPYGVGFKFGWGQILKFNPKGELKVTFSPQAGFLPTQFFVAGDGTVYVLAVDQKQLTDESNKEARRPPDNYVLRYRSDGTLDEKTKLDAKFIPSGSFVVFPSGEILVSAIEAPTGVGQPPSTPFTSLFDQNGAFVKRISSKEDEWIAKAVESHDTTKVVPGHGANPAVSMGQAIIGSDGNAYVMRKSIPAVVYVISSGGSLVRTLTLPSGHPPKYPSILLENRGQLAIAFQNSGPSEPRLRLFETLTGKPIQTVNVQTRFGAGAACFNPPNFTFVRVEDGKFVFTMAQAR
ncbi:MAG TPA: hypothetical protein VNZ03_00765 [Terriglobales bacterium]|jgi:hypothetical protein|nr:hypothetical protein [Terriglobales bacterium]